jgi:hypothetical protein
LLRAREGELPHGEEAAAAPRRKRRGWSIVALSLAALLAILAAGFGALSRKPPPLQVQRLPDGTPLSLVGVTYGRTHRFVRGTWFQKLLHPIVPGLVGGEEGDLTFSTDTLCLWLTRPARASGLSQEFRATAFDEQGCEVETGGLPASITSQGPERMEGWRLSTYPRRGKSVGFRFYERTAQGQWVQVAQFTIPNPGLGPYPSWTPEPFPTKKQNGDLAVTLIGLATGVRQSGPPGPSPRGEEPWTRLTFRTEQGGRRTTAWNAAYATVSDATGNTWLPSAWSQSPDQGTFEFVGRLCVHEPAYKVRVEFSRRSGFVPGETRTIRGVVVPKEGAAAPSSASAAFPGYRLTVEGITRGLSARLPGNSSFVSTAPVVQVRVSPPLSPGERLTLTRALDDRGRDLEGAELSSSSTVGEYHYGLPALKPDAKTASVTFAIHKSRFVEFLAKPSGP